MYAEQNNERTAVLGGGKIGEALLAGLLQGDRGAADIVVTEKYAERAAYLRETYGVRIGSVGEALEHASTLILAIKPQDIDALLAELAPGAGPRHLLISVAAGISIGHLERALADGVPVVRCMPNTAALVDEAMTALAPGTHATDEHLARAGTLLESVGRVVRVPESQLDAVTALSGSGPAYFFLMVEAMIDAGVSLGLPRALSAELVVQTAVGAATMLRDTGEHPVQLREAVSSPGGTTVAGTRELETHGLRAALTAAIEAAARRSRELGQTN